MYLLWLRVDDVHYYYYYYYKAAIVLRAARAGLHDNVPDRRSIKVAHVNAPAGDHGT